MALAILKRLKFLSKTGSLSKVERLAQNIKLPNNPVQYLSALRLASQSTGMNSAASSLKENQGFADAVAGIAELGTEEIQDAMNGVEKTMLRSSIERDIAQKYRSSCSSANPKLALISRTVAEWCGHHHAELAFMAGLVAEISHDAMYKKYPLLAAKTIARIHKEEASSYREAEMIEFGFDEAQLAAMTFKENKMPEAVIDAVASEPEQANDKELVLIVQFARFIAKAFEDKQQSPSCIWETAQQHIRKLHLNINQEEWSNKISLLFVNSLEFESAVAI